MERQRSTGLADPAHTSSTGSRGRPAKEPKLSGMHIPQDTLVQSGFAQLWILWAAIIPNVSGAMPTHKA